MNGKTVTSGHDGEVVLGDVKTGKNFAVAEQTADKIASGHDGLFGRAFGVERRMVESNEGGKLNLHAVIERKDCVDLNRKTTEIAKENIGSFAARRDFGTEFGKSVDVLTRDEESLGLSFDTLVGAWGWVQDVRVADEDVESRDDTVMKHRDLLV